MSFAQALHGSEATASLWLDLVAHEVLYSSVVLVVVLALTFLVGNRRPSVHYWLWSLVLVRLVLPTSLSSPWSAGRLLRERPASKLDARHVPDEGLPGPTAVPEDGRAWPWRTALLFSYLAATLVSGTVLHRRISSVRRAVANASPVTDPAILAQAGRLRGLFRIRRTVRVVTSERLLSPLTVGVLHPVVYLPRAVLDRSDAALNESVLAHEMAHIARGDDFWLRFQNLVQVVYFFHPAVWIAGSRINQAREQLCDEQVTSLALVPGEAYARSLLTVLRLGLHGPEEVSILGNHKRRFSMRIQQVLAARPETRRSRVLSLAGALLVGALLLPLASSGTSGSDTAGGASGGAATGCLAIALGNPLPEGWITSPFGARRNPMSGEPEEHQGIDLGSPGGQPILAPADGLVTIATTSYGPAPHLGTVLEIDHGRGVRTFYAHLGTLAVAANAHVRRGDTLGTIGSTGRSTGDHLHFEVWCDGQALDPASLFPGWKASLASPSPASATAEPREVPIKMACTLKRGDEVHKVTVTSLAGSTASIDDGKSGLSIELTPSLVPAKGDAGATVIQVGILICDPASEARHANFPARIRVAAGQPAHVVVPRTAGDGRTKALELTIVPTL